MASAAASTLKDALHTKAGMQHLSVYDVGKDEKPKFFLYSEPFKASKGKKVCNAESSATSRALRNADFGKMIYI